MLEEVIKEDMEWAALRDEMPEGVYTLLRRCLKKDQRQRLQAIGDARIEIDAIEEGLRAAATTRGCAICISSAWRMATLDRVCRARRECRGVGSEK